MQPGGAGNKSLAGPVWLVSGETLELSRLIRLRNRQRTTGIARSRCPRRASVCKMEESSYREIDPIIDLATGGALSV
jgi:hypothetical protein